MHDSRLLSLLKTLSGKEWNQLEAYLSGHHQSYNLSLFQELRKYAPRFKSKALSLGTFLQRWPENEKWTEKQLRQQFSRLTTTVEEGLSWLWLQEEEWRLALSLFATGQERGLEYLVRKAARRVEKLLEAYPLRDREFYLRQYEWAMIQYQYAQSDKRSFQPLLQRVSNALDTFFAFEKTRQVWQMANLEAMLDVEYDYGLGHEILQGASGHPIVDGVQAIYTQVLELTLGRLEEEEGWSQLVQVHNQIQNHLSLIPKLEAQQLYTSLLNYCTRKLNLTGANRYRRAYFDLNRALLEQGWLQEAGVLSPWRYINLVAVALALEEKEWTKQFIDSYQQQLPESQQDNAYHYALGHYYYALRKLDKAQEHLMLVLFEEPLFNAGVRLLMAKVLYDAKQEELLQHQLEANRLFFLRDKTIGDNRKAQLKAFNHFLGRLSRIPDFDKEALNDLKDSLPDPTEVISHNWLLERLQQRIAAH
jgi:hypothetical protein